jgi:hypothetical protein
LIAAYAGKINPMTPQIYRYLNFGKMDEYATSAKREQQTAFRLIT